MFLLIPVALWSISFRNCIEGERFFFYRSSSSFKRLFASSYVSLQCSNILASERIFIKGAPSWIRTRKRLGGRRNSIQGSKPTWRGIYSIVLYSWTHGKCLHCRLAAMSAFRKAPVIACRNFVVLIRGVVSGNLTLCNWNEISLQDRLEHLYNTDKTKQISDYVSYEKLAKTVFLTFWTHTT